MLWNLSASCITYVCCVLQCSEIDRDPTRPRRHHRDAPQPDMKLCVFLLALSASAHAWGKNDKKREMSETEHMEAAEYEEQARAAGARDYEIENLKRRKAGEIDDAQLGINNLANAMNDPSAMGECTCV